MSFKVGDRVKTPQGTEGTVRYVGRVNFGKGTHVGVELDTPDGKHNGTENKKSYFKCKRKHGIIKKPSYFSAVKASRKGKRKSVSSKGSKSKGKSAKTKLIAVEEKDEGDSDDNSKKKKKGKSAPPKVTTNSIAMQTEAPSDIVENEYYCKLITRLYTEQFDKLKKERDEATQKTISLQQIADNAEAEKKQLEYEIKQQSVELDPLRESLELKEVELEELQIKLEIAQIENEELNEKLKSGFNDLKNKIDTKNDEIKLLKKK
eukprot:96234_1